MQTTDKYYSNENTTEYSSQETPITKDDLILVAKLLHPNEQNIHSKTKGLLKQLILGSTYPGGDRLIKQEVIDIIVKLDPELTLRDIMTLKSSDLNSLLRRIVTYRQRQESTLDIIQNQRQEMRQIQTRRQRRIQTEENQNERMLERQNMEQRLRERIACGIQSLEAQTRMLAEEARILEAQTLETRTRMEEEAKILEAGRLLETRPMEEQNWQVEYHTPSELELTHRRQHRETMEMYNWQIAQLQRNIYGEQIEMPIANVLTAIDLVESKLEYSNLPTADLATYHVPIVYKTLYVEAQPLPPNYKLEPGQIVVRAEPF